MTVEREAVAYRTRLYDEVDETGQVIAGDWCYTETPLKNSEPLYTCPPPAAPSEVTEEMVERLFTEMDRRMAQPKHIHQESNPEWLPVDDTQIGVEFAVEFITAALKGGK